MRIEGGGLGKAKTRANGQGIGRGKEKKNNQKKKIIKKKGWDRNSVTWG